MDKIEFEVRVVHEKPIDLIEIANSLIALNNISQSHISKEHGVRESKILLQNVREGSDILKLVLDFGACVLPILDGTKTLMDIVKYIKSYQDLENKSIQEIKEDKHYNSFESSQVEKLIAPVLDNNNNSTIEINIEGDNKAPILFIDRDIANKISNNVDLVKSIENKVEEKKDDKSFEKVLIKIHKATDTHKKVKDSSYCDDIIKGKAIATIFENEEDKKEVLQNPFTTLFLVDIVTAKIDGEVKLYRVVKLHKIIPLDEDI